MKIRDRIKELRRVKASELLPNPKNWRTHPKAQQDALKGILAEVGYADALIARETDAGLMLIDGHLRAESTPDSAVPVLILDVTEAEADKILATLDPLAALAETNAQALDALLREVESGSAAVQEMLAGIAEGAGLYNVEPSDSPELPDGDKAPFQEMTFTLHDAQAAEVKRAIEAAKGQGGDKSDVNENSNGNALAFICEAFLCG